MKQSKDCISQHKHMIDIIVFSEGGGGSARDGEVYKLSSSQ